MDRENREPQLAMQPAIFTGGGGQLRTDLADLGDIRVIGVERGGDQRIDAAVIAAEQRQPGAVLRRSAGFRQLRVRTRGGTQSHAASCLGMNQPFRAWVAGKRSAMTSSSVAAARPSTVRTLGWKISLSTTAATPASRPSARPATSQSGRFGVAGKSGTDARSSGLALGCEIWLLSAASLKRCRTVS